MDLCHRHVLPFIRRPSAIRKLSTFGIGLKYKVLMQSFLHGSRLTSAGLITIRHGQLRKLSPLSGHYRCSTRPFRYFLHAMEQQGVDMSKVHNSRSYIIMVRLFMY
jgi:hypothetical protein